MEKIPKLLGIHAKPSKALRISLIVLPFFILIVSYLIASEIRRAENPADKLLPSVGQMADAIERLAFQEDRRTGDYLFWKDTYVSLKRIGLGVGLAFIFALLFGLNVGMYPGLNYLLNPIVTFISMIPPLAILPILFLSLGVDELAKVTLIFIGTAPILSRDIYLAVRKIPRELNVKALTLGASTPALLYRIILPQVLPKALDSLRLVLGGAWLFLIASEAIASTEGLGYRIYLARRFLSMDIIIPYVFWITLLGFLLDFSLKWAQQKFYPWYQGSDK